MGFMLIIIIIIGFILKLRLFNGWQFSMFIQHFEETALDKMPNWWNDIALK